MKVGSCTFCFCFTQKIKQMEKDYGIIFLKRRQKWEATTFFSLVLHKNKKATEKDYGITFSYERHFFAFNLSTYVSASCR